MAVPGITSTSLADDISNLAKKRQDITTKVRNAPEMHSGGLIGMGGLANVASGELMMDNFAAEQALKAANIIQSYLPQSGAVINQLQADKTLGGVTGTSEPVIIDNSSQPTIINQTNIASPQTRGNPLPGMGRDLGVTHLKYG